MRFAILFGLVFVLGCGGASAPPPEAKPDAETKIKETLAKLPPDERAAAEKQRICPVSGERLGTMGVPPKVEVQGRTAWLCCKGCEEDLKSDPGKYLAKLEPKND